MGLIRFRAPLTCGFSARDSAILFARSWLTSLELALGVDPDYVDFMGANPLKKRLIMPGTLRYVLPCSNEHVVD